MERRHTLITRAIYFAQIIPVGVIVLCLLCGLFVIDDEYIAIRTLQNQGFANIRIQEKRWFLVSLHGCESDGAKFTVHAY